MENKLKQGEALFAEGKIEEAEKCFLGLLEKNAEDMEALNNLGVLHYARGNIEEAENYFLQALAIKEDYPDAVLNLADLYQNTKSWQKAASQLEKFIAIENQDMDVFNRLGMVYLEIGNIEKARTVLSKSLELNPDQETVRDSLKALEKKTSPSMECNGEIEKRKTLFAEGKIEETENHILLNRIKDSNHMLLPEFLQDMRQIFDADVFVETGTLLGYTADAARKIFREVYTIELGQDLHQAAAQRFAQIDNCHTYQGDSADVLKKILPGIEGKMLFWLDAHFSEGITAKGETNTPILAELQAIKESGKKDAIILIDDIRYFQTIESRTHDDSALQGYPLLQQVRDEVYAIDNAYQFVTLGDIALAYPSVSAVSVSPLIRACTVSRLFDNSNEAIDAVLDAEKAIARSQGQEHEAIQMLAKSVLATGENPVGGHYRLWYGLILTSQNRYTEACDEFLQAIERGCNHWRVLWYFAHAVHKAGRNDAALFCSRMVEKMTVKAMDWSLDPQDVQEAVDKSVEDVRPYLGRNSRSKTKAASPSEVKDTHWVEGDDKAFAKPQDDMLSVLQRHNLHKAGTPLRLHLGCGEQHFEGYVNIDYPPSEHNVMSAKADIFADVMKLHFPAESVDEIRLHHVFEHFSRVTALAMLIKWHKWLKIGGKLHIETPDLIGSAKTLVSNTSWKTKMGVVRHLAGDQAASWAYHIDHWFPERFEHTLRKLGFDPVKTRSLSWQHEPYLSNVEAIAIKARYVSIEKQLRNADELLWESTVAPAEKTTYGVWSKQLRAVIGNTLVSAPGNTETPDVSEILQAPAVLSQFASQLPLSEIHGFNQNDRNAWVRAKAASVPNGAHVLDIGAGTCPYRDLFAHCDYKTHDFEKYRGVKLGGAIEYGEIDYVSDILNIPVEDNSFDVILCTEVLEHVPEPIEALREMARILRPGGRIFLTAPLGSGLHQLPYHYYGGYTPEWYKHFFPKFGLNVKEITPNGGFFKLLAQECVRVVSTLPEHRHLHGNNVEFIRALFGELIPRYLFALEERHFIDQFTVGYHVEAMKNADTVITDNPKFDRDTNIAKGEAAFNKGDFEEAEKYFLEALKTDSKKKEAYNNLGVIAFQKKNIRESIDYFTKALEIDPFYKDAIINYSVLLKSLDRFHESIPILEKAVDKFPHDKELSHLLNEVRLTQKSQTKIAVLCLPGLQSFLGDIVDYLKTKYDVRTCYSNNNQEIESAVRWADVVWLEWANELTVAITNHPTMLDSKRVICRLHSYEALAGYARKINWERIADLIFVAKHIKDIVLQQVSSLPNRVKKIHIVPNGVNLDKFIFRDRFKGKNLAYLGQINYKKGPMLLLHAFRELVQLDKKYRLFIGGNFQDARYELYFSQMIKEMGLEKNIQIDGWIEDVRTWLEDKHYVVCSSVLEGHPVGLMEAMACGLKPIIHNFVGAKGIYPTKYLWNVIPEFVQKVTHENYDSSEYRRFIETNYSLDIQLRMIDNILNKPKKVKQIPVTGNMIAGTAEKPYNYNDVTAVIAVRNGSTTIKKTLDSLLSQTVPLKKIIVVDDCSNDETPKVVEDYAAKSDGKIELLKLPYNHWVYKARNAAFEKIETEFFFFLDADDFVEPSYTERLLTVLRENPDCAFAYSDMIHFNESQQVQTSLPDFDVTTLMERNYIPYSTLMRYSDFRSLGGYSNYLNDCRNHMTEWDLWLRFVAAGKAGKRYPEPLFYYYQAADQMSKNYERVRSDMHLQMALNRGASCTLNCGNASKTLLVCQGRDYLDRSKVGFEVYTWLKPLAKFGEVFTFFYDVESQYFGQDGMIKRLLSLIDQIQPTYIFHPAYKEHISIDCWKEISKRFVTMVWFSDDNWRFASYSKRYCHGFRFALTTYPEVYGQYKAMDYRTILLSQWAANTEYFRDHGLPKDIDVSFCGQKYGDRSDLLEGSGIQCFGKGWPNGLLDFPEMARVLNRSKISINFSKGADGKLQMKLRPFEIAASNTLLLCEKTDELNKYYKIGKEVIVFENKEDLRQKIDYYLQHEEERKQIARAAYERTIKEHTWSNRFEEIIKAVNGELM